MHFSKERATAGGNKIDEEGKRKRIEGREKNKDNAKKCEKLEAEEKRKCIVIRGLQNDRRGLEKEMEVFQDEAGNGSEYATGRPLGQERKVNWVIFGTLEDKENIMGRTDGKRLRQEPIYIEHDRTRGDRDIQREIVPYAKRLKEDRSGWNMV